jgi:hypothetical protein
MIGWIKNSINNIVGMDIYNNITFLQMIPENISDLVVSDLLIWGCESTTFEHIEKIRELFTQLPTKFAEEKIKKSISNKSIDVNDYWCYLRLLELASVVSEDLFNWVKELEISPDSDDYKEIMEYKKDYSYPMV